MMTMRSDLVDTFHRPSVPPPPASSGVVLASQTAVVTSSSLSASSTPSSTPGAAGGGGGGPGLGVLALAAGLKRPRQPSGGTQTQSKLERHTVLSPVDKTPKTSEASDPSSRLTTGLISRQARMDTDGMAVDDETEAMMRMEEEEGLVEEDLEDEEEEDEDDEAEERDRRAAGLAGLNNASPGRPLDLRRTSEDSSDGDPSDGFFRAIHKDGSGLLTSSSASPSGLLNTKKKGVKSFCIDDILSHKTAELQQQQQQRGVGSGHHQQPHAAAAASVPGFVRPWDRRLEAASAGVGSAAPAVSPSGSSDGGSGGERVRRASSASDSPLDALFNMATNFEALKAKSDLERAQMNFANKVPPKKKRKSRTAFTNHQIFELEKRFLYQKYLSPADRDEIAAQLGLTNAQVICWFQNRRAKFKRDMEELKKDVEKTPLSLAAAGAGCPPPPPPPTSVAAAAAAAAAAGMLSTAGPLRPPPPPPPHHHLPLHHPAALTPVSLANLPLLCLAAAPHLILADRAAAAAAGGGAPGGGPHHGLGPHHHPSLHLPPGLLGHPAPPGHHHQFTPSPTSSPQSPPRPSSSTRSSPPIRSPDSDSPPIRVEDSD